MFPYLHAYITRITHRYNVRGYIAVLHGNTHTPSLTRAYGVHVPWHYCLHCLQMSCMCIDIRPNGLPRCPVHCPYPRLVSAPGRQKMVLNTRLAAIVCCAGWGKENSMVSACAGY